MDRFRGGPGERERVRERGVLYLWAGWLAGWLAELERGGSFVCVIERFVRLFLFDSTGSFVDRAMHHRLLPSNPRRKSLSQVTEN